MAIRCSYPVLILPRGQIKKAMPRASMLHNSHIQHTRAATSSCKSFTGNNNNNNNNKVFEDQAMGIVCYIDGMGELVCEGYDEGPRFSRSSSNGADQKRCKDHQIPDCQELMELQIARDDEFYRIMRKQN